MLSGIGEFDRVMGNGTVVDSVNIITAPPGTGKSTLLLEVANNFSFKGKKVLYIAGEESKEQIKLRADRVLEKINENFYIKYETELNQIKSDIEFIKPDFLIVDSIQMMYDKTLPNPPGGDTQILHFAESIGKMSKESKDKKMAVFFVGQMTKDDKLMGSNKLAHYVDAIFMLEGEAGFPLRMFRATKNRYGSTEEVGLFEMNENGMEEILNPHEYFITKRDSPIEGVALSMTMEGTRNIAIEVETLCETTMYPNPVRVSEGINRQQIQIYSAVMQRMGGNIFS